MQITMHMTRGLPGSPETTINVSGETLTVDGTPYDLSVVPDGGEATVPRDETHPFVGPVARLEGKLHCAIVVRVDDTADPRQLPKQIVADISEGDLFLDIPRKREPEIPVRERDPLLGPLPDEEVEE